MKIPVCVCAGCYDGLATPQVQHRLTERIPGAGYREFESGHPFFVQEPSAAPVIVAALASSPDQQKVGAGGTAKNGANH